MILTMLLSLALQDATATAPVAATPKPKAERKICKAKEETGSRLGGTRECHTATEWAALQTSADPRLLDELNNNGGRQTGLLHN